MHPLLTIALCAFIGCMFIASMIGDFIAAGLFLGLVVVTACTAHDAKVSKVSAPAGDNG